MKILATVLLVATLVIGAVITTSFTIGRRNIDYLKASSGAFFAERGYKVLTYEGYEHGVVFGGRVWYQVQRPGSPVVYQGMIIKYIDEIHLYNFHALNAVEGK